jgi:hypothetical protein
MRTYLVSVISAAFFVVLYFAGILQDRIRRKTGASPFSLGFLWRSFGTKELYLFIATVLLLFSVGALFVVLDQFDHFPK